LFLAQLSNLLAGNISIVHGVTGSSRTFMGEEAAGVDAVRVALSRVAAGQSDIALVGGASNAERKDMLMLHEFGGFALKGEFRPVWGRAASPGFASGSIGAFLVIEAADHARSRRAKPIARLSAVFSQHGNRHPGAVVDGLKSLWARLPGKVSSPNAAVISGATGVDPATREERAFLGAHSELAVRATGTHIGHGLEPQFAMNVAIAALAVSKGHLFSACDDTGFERATQEPLKQAVVTAIGHWRGEGLGLIEAVH
jgi:3-oxoacyl-[acyl-carrier-protein] synthase II